MKRDFWIIFIALVGAEVLAIPMTALGILPKEVFLASLIIACALVMRARHVYIAHPQES